MEKLSPSLRAELSMHIYGRVVLNAPFLRWMNDNPVAVAESAIALAVTTVSR